LFIEWLFFRPKMDKPPMLLKSFGGYIGVYFKINTEIVKSCT
jgi:hypothetical protein